uniref:Olfactory receptor n=1 Tax=Gadus morhua TaxID=8049 RepID=A0A8C5CCJ6_GADMO
MEVHLESLNLETGNIYPAFIFGTLAYLITIFFNMLVLTTIVFTKSLHKPMFLLLLNLPIMDMIGATAFLPQLVTSIVSKNRAISYPGCFLQALSIHIYGTGNLMFLSAMAYDRYIAICLPLRYNAIMTSNILIRIISTMWVFSLILVSVIFILLLRLPRCKSLITHSYCDNPSLLGLVCADTSINNIYGLFTVAIVQLIGHASILYTYLHILVACCKTKRSDTKSKAMQTCATHLVVFLLLECMGLFTIISYRLNNISPVLRRFIGASAIIFPSTLNPIIYGLKTKEIRGKALAFFRKRIFIF